MTLELSEPDDYSAARKERSAKPGWDELRLSATVIALDPGGTTGWALWDVNPEALSDPYERILTNVRVWQHSSVDCGATKGNLGNTKHSGISTTGEAAGVAELIALVKAWPGAAVVIEDFIVRQYNQSRDFLSPVRVTAGLSQWLWRMNRDYFVQQPAMAKTTVTDARLKKWGIYDPSSGPHARDADRHAITFLRQCKADPKFRARAFPHLYSEGASFGPGSTPTPHELHYSN